MQTEQADDRQIHAKTLKAGIPRRRHRHPREDPRKDVGVSGESARMSLSVSVLWNAGLMLLAVMQEAAVMTDISKYE